MNSLERIKEDLEKITEQLPVGFPLNGFVRIQSNLKSLEQEIKASDDLNLVYMKGFSDGKAEMIGKVNLGINNTKLTRARLYLDIKYHEHNGNPPKEIKTLSKLLNKAMITAAQED